MAKRPDVKAKIVDCALDLAARDGWSAVTLGDIAEAAGIDLGRLLADFRTKTHVLAAFAARTDEAVIAGLDTDMADEPTVDRLFDVLMRRFEALAPHRDGVRAIARAGCRDPLRGAGHGLLLARSMALMLEAAGIAADGLGGLVRTKGLAAVYLATMRVWLRDDSDQMERTMDALRTNLHRAERWARRGCRLRPRRASKATADQTA